MSSTPLSAEDGNKKSQEFTTPAKATTPRQKAAAAKKVKAETEATASGEKSNKSGSSKVFLVNKDFSFRADLEPQRKPNSDANVKAEAVTPSKRVRLLHFPLPATLTD